MGRTLKAIADREFDETRSYHPGELADGRFSDLTNPPSLAALKLHEILFKTAGAAVADDRWHKIDLATIRSIEGIKNYDRRGLVSLFKELRGVVMEYDTDTETIIAGLIDIAKVEFEDGNGPAIVRWKFGEGFREIVANSDYWALIDRSASLAMTSRYALRLHQIIALRGNLDHKASEIFKLEDLRARLGVPAGKLVSWGSLAQKALKPAVEEVNHLTRFHVTVTPQKRGRSVVAVEFTWSQKESLAETKAELGKHSSGRKVRREGTVETVLETGEKPVGGRGRSSVDKAQDSSSASLGAFPASGGISFNGWAEVARRHLPSENRPDVDIVADRFRQWAAEKAISLSSAGIQRTFEGFCQKWRP